ncbi:MAG: hypothetical protein LBR22_00165 [Desulfovibrio sp.]|jgi:hypothetical protein|nr:hypothetical protein [Desulfovibrio sp.]
MPTDYKSLLLKTDTEICSMIDKALDDDISIFYDSPVIKGAGLVKIQRSKELSEQAHAACSEICATRLLERIDTMIDKLHNIPITRESSYKIHSYQVSSDLNQSNRKEELIAHKMYNDKMTLGSLGNVMDFQTPLKNKETDSVGKIDLLSYNEKENSMSMIELKAPQNTESLLRCVTEIYTYNKIVNKKKLLDDFGKPNANLRMAVLVFEDCRAYYQFNNCPNVRKLMYKLKVDFYAMKSTDDFKITFERRCEDIR